MRNTEWENANILEWELRTNPKYNHIHTCIFDIEDKNDFVGIMNSIAHEIDSDSNIIIHIYAHGDSVGTAFKNIKDANIPKNYILWNEYIPLLHNIKKRIAGQLVLVMHSCQAMNITKEEGIEDAIDYLLAPEGNINGRRAREQFACFYDAYSSILNCEKAYNATKEVFPDKEEMKLKEEERSIINIFPKS